MKTRIRIVLVASAACLFAALLRAPNAFTQQPTAAAPAAVPTAKQEFFAAIRKGDAASVGEMLKQDPALARASAANGATATLFAVYTNHKEIAELLIASGIEPNVFESAATGRVARVRELLKQNPELVRAYSPDGWTALHLNFGNLDVTKLLLGAGADINAVSKNKLVATPLQGAVVMKNIALARLLLGHGAKVSPRGEGGESPLHEAAGSGEIEIAKLLLERGADVNAKDDAGKTPLTIALENKQTGMASFLRRHKAAQ